MEIVMIFIINAWCGSADNHRLQNFAYELIQRLRYSVLVWSIKTVCKKKSATFSYQLIQ
jgi:hypothetical protein